MATAKNNAKSSEKDADATALKDESKTTQTTEQAAAAEENVPTSAEKREAPEDNEVKADEVGTRTGIVFDGDNDAFDEDAEWAAEDFEDGGNFEGAVGVTVERDIDGNEYEAPYALLTAADLEPVRTSDSDDPAKSWTAQEYAEERKDEDGNDIDPVALVPVDGTPGQTFRVRELPDRSVAEAAGINYDQWVAGLPVRVDVPNEAPRRGTPA